MSRRYQLTDVQWGLIEPLFPHHRISGRPTREPRQVLDGILWILHTGAPWRDLPERFCPWSSVYNTFRRWQSTGRIDAILEALQLHLNVRKVLSTSTCGALTAPMSGHPKMLLDRVKKHSGKSISWSITWRFWQQDSLGH